jgi:uncharacterized membrane protein
MAMDDTRRIDSLDLVRGVVMILMAIDHVRVYAGVPAGGPDPAVFFTRWVTHFVAPAFCFLAGTGAYLLGRKLNDPKALTKFLVTRGLVLVFLELTVIRVSWAWNLDYANYMIAGVIWMLGWCMVLMGALTRLSTRTIGIAGIIVVAGQSILSPLGRFLPGPFAVLFNFLYGGGNVGPLGILYVIVPWIGVMMLGYAFGALYSLDDAARRRRTLMYGAAITGFFVIVGGGIALASSSGDGNQAPFFVRWLGQRKYPASPLFLAMTLGPTLLFLPLAEKLHGRRMWNWITTFGRVPMFYYLLHIPLIHVAAALVSRIRVGLVDPWLFGNFPLAPSEQPAGYRWSLSLLYFVWALCVVALYFPSAWYAREKAAKRSRWMSYI